VWVTTPFVLTELVGRLQMQSMGLVGMGYSAMHKAC
jgi:hypothetical protein